MGIAGAAFNTARTPQNFTAWYAEEREKATTYLKSVAVQTGNVAALNAIDAIEAGTDAAAALAAVGTVANIYAQIDAQGIAAVQAARVGTLGWEAKGPAKQPPALTGELSMVAGLPTLKTAAGTFTVQSINPVGANDISAFAGRVVTVRGWPDGTWQPGGTATLMAEEWAPGTSHEFVTGRIAVDGDNVSIRVNPNKKVLITDATLKGVLKAYNELGIVLPGPVVGESTSPEYRTAPEDYYILGGFSNAQNPALAAEAVVFNLQLAHGKSLKTNVPRVAWDSVPRTQRHYLYGHIENGEFKAKGLTPTAGGWSSPAYTPGVESTKFVQYAVPTIEPAFTPEQAKFGM